MTNEEAIEIIRTEIKCVKRNDNAQCDRKCESCDLVLPTSKVIKAYDLAIEALRRETNHNSQNSIYPLRCWSLFKKEDRLEDEEEVHQQ